MDHSRCRGQAARGSASGGWVRARETGAARARAFEEEPNRVSGIVAANGPFDPDLGQRMLSRLVHRGPDGEGSRRVGDSWLGHRRLAIVDLEHGGQPLGNRAGDLWLVGDGGSTTMTVSAPSWATSAFTRAPTTRPRFTSSTTRASARSSGSGASSPSRSPGT